MPHAGDGRSAKGGKINLNPATEKDEQVMLMRSNDGQYGQDRRAGLRLGAYGLGDDKIGNLDVFRRQAEAGAVAQGEGEQKGWRQEK